MKLSWIFFALGSVAGVSYWILGILASADFVNKETSASDRFLSTGLLWSLDKSKYATEGQIFCRLGNIICVAAVASWISWGVFS